MSEAKRIETLLMRAASDLASTPQEQLANTAIALAVLALARTGLTFKLDGMNEQRMLVVMNRYNAHDGLVADVMREKARADNYAKQMRRVRRLVASSRNELATDLLDEVLKTAALTEEPADERATHAE